MARLPGARVLFVSLLLIAALTYIAYREVSMTREIALLRAEKEATRKQCQDALDNSREANKLLRADLQSCRVSLKETGQETQLLRDAADRDRQARMQLNEKISEQAAELEQLLAVNEDLEAAKAQAKKEAEDFTGRIRESERALEAAREEVKKGQSEKTEAQLTVSGLKEEVSSLEESLRSCQMTAKAREADMQKQNDESAKIQARQVEDRMTQLKREIEMCEEGHREAEALLGSCQNERSIISAKNENLTLTIASLDSAAVITKELLASCQIKCEQHQNASSSSDVSNYKALFEHSSAVDLELSACRQMHNISTTNEQILRNKWAHSEAESKLQRVEFEHRYNSLQNKSEETSRLLAGAVAAHSLCVAQSRDANVTLAQELTLDIARLKNQVAELNGRLGNCTTAKPPPTPPAPLVELVAQPNQEKHVALQGGAGGGAGGADVRVEVPMEIHHDVEHHEEVAAVPLLDDVHAKHIDEHPPNNNNNNVDLNDHQDNEHNGDGKEHPLPEGEH